jgi:hypothetical protein
MVTVSQHVHPRSAVVWVDGWHALVARSLGGRPGVTEVDREADSEHDYLLRVARAADDCDRLMILGPGRARTAFEHEYAILFGDQRRFVDAETAPPTTARELIDRLHVLDPDERRH